MELGLGYQLGGMTAAQFASIQGQYAAIRGQILARGGTSEETPQLVMTDDGQWISERKDWKIIQYLLGQIADNTKKQLEGIYNMPEGANFWFPSSALASIQNAAGGGGITLDNLPGAISAGIKMAGTTGPGMGMTINPNVTNPITSTWNPLIPMGPFQNPTPLGGINQTPTPGSWLDQLLKPVGPPAPDTTSNEMFSKILDMLTTLNSTLFKPSFTPPPSGVGGTPFMGDQESFANAISEGIGGVLGLGKEVKLPTLNTKIELMSTIQLIADGRTLASVVAPWLGEFLSNFNGSTTSQTLSAVI
jgi:hypothetical protein